MHAPNRVPWRRVGVEVVVVVGSILLAFGIQAWWDDQEQRDLRTATLEALLADFEGVSGYRDAIVTANGRYIESERLLITLLDRPNQSPVQVPDSLLFATLMYPTYNPPRASVEMALASGRLTTIDDEALRHLLATWLQQLDDTAEDEARMAELVEDKIMPLLASTPGLAELLADLPSRSIFQMPESVRRSFHSVVPSAELQGLLGVRVIHTRSVLSELQRLTETEEEIVSSLRSALTRR